jgi:PAS domain S-box-containing protein
MHLASASIAHGLIGRNGRVQQIDGAYAALLGMPAEGIIGRPAVEFMHSADKAAATAILRRAWREDRATSATLRHQRRDGAAVWVNVQVWRIGSGDAAQLVISGRELADTAEVSAVADHWHMARLLLLAIQGAKRAFGDALIANPATEILLIVYIAEAEAQSATAVALADRIRLPWPLARRWLNALVDSGFVEAELEGPVREETPFRLTQRAHTLIESLFVTLVTAINGPPVPA